jgi:Asp-tRNA(Asn)/Glu-tRNA(Gln) amidotransferase C subunit
LAKELQTVKSWTATAHRVGDAWTRGDVPTPYVKETLEKTQQELKNETDTLSKLSIEPSQRATVLEQLKRFEDTVGQMSKVVEQKNPQAMTQQIQQLSIQEQTLDKLAKTVGG